jgi:RNA polymerase sigma factor (sigma-70 family)
MQTLTAVAPTMTASELKRFEDLFHEHSEMVFRTACVVTGCREDAEDVLQTIFLRLIRRAVPPSFNRNPKVYFYRSAINLSLTAIRSRRRHLQLTDRDVFDGPQPAVNNQSNEVILRHLLEAVAALSPRTVEILVLRYVHDYTEAEIAQLLGRSRGTVAVTLFRAKARLRKLGRLPHLD